MLDVLPFELVGEVVSACVAVDREWAMVTLPKINWRWRRAFFESDAGTHSRLLLSSTKDWEAHVTCLEESCVEVLGVMGANDAGKEIVVDAIPETVRVLYARGPCLNFWCLPDLLAEFSAIDVSLNLYDIPSTVRSLFLKDVVHEYGPVDFGIMADGMALGVLVLSFQNVRCPFGARWLRRGLLQQRDVRALMISADTLPQTTTEFGVPLSVLVDLSHMESLECLFWDVEPTVHVVAPTSLRHLTVTSPNLRDIFSSPHHAPRLHTLHLLDDSWVLSGLWNVESFHLAWDGVVRGSVILPNAITGHGWVSPSALEALILQGPRTLHLTVAVWDHMFFESLAVFRNRVASVTVVIVVQSPRAVATYTLAEYAATARATLALAPGSGVKVSVRRMTQHQFTARRGELYDLPVPTGINPDYWTYVCGNMFV